jgi:hypothetical protein
MNIIRSIIPILLSIIDMVINNLNGKMDYVEFQKQLANKLNEVAREILRLVLEEMDREIKQKKKERKGWQVCRNNDHKEVGTLFGQVGYERTYYQHNETKDYAYLVDKQVGYTPHLRIDQNVKAELVTCAANQSYRKSGQLIGEQCGNISISGQTVKQAVDTFERSTITKQKRKQIKTLYIEADEDHVACQRGRRFEARLVYIHEGWETNGKRRVAQANGQSVAEEYKLQRRQNLPVITIESKVLEKEHKKLQEAREVLNNIPILQGSKSFLWQALKSLSLA